jgi:hypothetical protein
MREKNYSEGPWNLTSFEKGEVGEDSSHASISTNVSGFIIIEMTRSDQAAANANLIEAAPHMIEALESVLGELERCHRAMGGDYAIIHKVKEAINRAYGE